MSYQVIARKYRPQRFEDVVGQEHVTQTLSNAIGQKRIAHACLFVGPRGTGKTTIARIFAKCLNCADGPRVDFSEDDPRVQEITEGRALDVLEIDGASNRGIDEVRALRETVKYAPAAGRFKIYIIDEVHMLTKEAFNALLKTLEEPPAHVKFMFATTEPEKMPLTILSRCQRFDLRRIPSGLIVKHLRQIAQQESVKIEEPALEAIARGADGGMRDAQSALDQLISFCGGDIGEADVLSMFGLAAEGQILALSQAVLAGETTRALRQLNDLAEQGKDLARIVSELLRHFRNLLVYQVSRGEPGLIEASEAEAAALATQSPLATAEALTRMMDVLTDCEGRLRDTASRKILLEVTLLKMMEARHAVSIDTVLRQLQQLRAEAGGVLPRATGASAPAAGRSLAPAAVGPTGPAAAPAPQPLAAPAAGGELGQLWSRLLEAVNQASPFVHAYLIKAQPVSLRENLLTIGFDPEFADQIALVDNSKNHALFQTKLAELGHPQVKVRIIEAAAAGPMADGPTAPATPAAKPGIETAPPRPKGEAVSSGKEDFKKDPLIEKALEIFKGQIVETRS
ncbi:MAG: DNA polymerase III subunit gamma/tau [Verrucomicrobiota bacterium]|jgi:DNA polymerase-3 subunit gamma/tau